MSGYLPGCRVSLPIDRYQIILLCNGHKGVSNLPRVIMQGQTVTF